MSGAHSDLAASFVLGVARRSLAQTMFVTTLVCIYCMYGDRRHVLVAPLAPVADPVRAFAACARLGATRRWAVAYMAQANPLIQPKRTNWHMGAEH